jgi:hypothetical protein
MRSTSTTLGRCASALSVLKWRRGRGRCISLPALLCSAAPPPLHWCGVEWEYARSPLPLVWSGSPFRHLPTSHHRAAPALECQCQQLHVPESTADQARKRPASRLTSYNSTRDKVRVLLQVYGPLQVARATPLARWADPPDDPIPLAHMIPPAFTHAATFVWFESWRKPSATC